MTIRLILGLGNPGRRYEDTRHNIGYRALDHLSNILKARFNKDVPTAVLAEGGLDEQTVILAKPITYMNRSGAAARQIAEKEGILPEEILVISDDSNLPLGQLRVRRSGTHGGHNGLRSIIECLGTDQFGRIRCGVGAPESREIPLEDYVLDGFLESEEEIAEDMARRAAEAALVVCRESYEAAMARYNKKVENNEQ